jgi:acyl-CoA thioesterase FadM
MGDVDAAGILYFPAAYRWLEELFTGWLKAEGHPISEMLEGAGACPCVASAATYPAPVTVDDELWLSLHPTRIGTTSFGIAATARRVDDGTPALHVGSWHVWSTFTGRGRGLSLTPGPLPGWLRDALESTPTIDPPRPALPAAAISGGRA